MEYSRVLGATLFSGETRIDAEHPLTAPDQQTAELVLTPASPLRDRTLAQANFDWHYQLIPLAVHRPGEETAISHATSLRDIRLGVGDDHVVEGEREGQQTAGHHASSALVKATLITRPMICRCFEFRSSVTASAKPTPSSFEALTTISGSALVRRMIGTR